MFRQLHNKYLALNVFSVSEHFTVHAANHVVQIAHCKHSVAVNLNLNKAQFIYRYQILIMTLCESVLRETDWDLDRKFHFYLLSQGSYKIINRREACGSFSENFPCSSENPKLHHEWNKLQINSRGSENCKIKNQPRPWKQSQWRLKHNEIQSNQPTNLKIFMKPWSPYFVPI